MCQRHGVSEGQQKVWQRVLQQVQSSVSSSRFRTFLARSLLLELTEGCAVVGLSSEYARTWADGRLRSDIEGAVRTVVQDEASLQCRVIG